MKHAPQNRSWARRFFCSKLMLCANLLLVGFVGWSLSREFADGREATANLSDLQKQMASLEAKNSDYADTIAKLGTPAFVEREARLKLGYQKSGEQVLMLRSISASQVASGETTASDDAALGNPQKWWRYFLGGD